MSTVGTVASNASGILKISRSLLKDKVVVVVLSGGQDSTTCLYLARECGAVVHVITFDYGQRHSLELHAARKVAEMCTVASHEFISIPDVLRSTSPLVSDAPLEQYADHQSLPGGIEKTFVPMRNALFLTLAANRAAYHNAHWMITGVSQEDYGGYPDCRREFLDAFASTVEAALGESIPITPGIFAPLLFLSKAETVRLAALLPGCLYPASHEERYGALAYTHTAYDGQYPPVGHDHASLLRAKGFEEAGVADPLVLRAVDEGLMARPSTFNYQPRSIPDSPPAA